MKSATSKKAVSDPAEVDIRKITIPEVWRQTDSFVVQELARSFQEHGQLNPIVLNEAFTLIAGKHRILASQFLGWNTIRAVFLTCSELEQELATLSENLVRAELCPLDRCLASARSKEIYETLHPETKRGGKRPEGGVAEEVVDCFGKRTAKLRGVSDRTIRREVAIGKALAHLPHEVLRGESIAALEQLSQLPMEEQQQVLELMEQRGMDLSLASTASDFYRDRDSKAAESEPVVEVRSSRKTTASKPPNEIVESSSWEDFPSRGSLNSAWPKPPKGGGVQDRPSGQLTAVGLLKRVEDVVQSLAEIADALPVGNRDDAAKLLDEVLSYFGWEIDQRFEQPIEDEGEDADAEARQVVGVTKQKRGAKLACTP